nr:hypothetical protein [Kibdelosporangium sp. MJ126-NF4]CEL15129.1 putative integral membrane protein [Kibdelosporangium sp. MJ126-NF4]CTQ93275.1 putative integral membrane protein [Kibdelosporangium sp. MJ126-NF4]
MPPPRRRPATPPTRRPKVAGLHRRADHADDTHTSDVDLETPAAPESTFDVPVIGEQPTNGHHTEKSPERTPEKAAEQEVKPTPRRRVTVPRKQDPKPEAAKPETAEPEAVTTEAEPQATTDTEPEATAEAEATQAPAEAELEAEAAPELVEQEQAASGADQPEQQKLLIPAILVVVALLLGGLGYWFTQNLSDARTGLGNDALADVNATKDIVGAANTAVTAVLSYKFDDMPGAAQRAKEYLVGEAVEQYDKSMKALENDIRTQQLQVVVTPVSVGVVRFSGDEARVLVYADQVGTRADKQPSGGPTQFAMDMRFTGGKWRIVKLDFFEVPK